MIKAIIFDFGNVICSFNNDIYLNRISDLTGKSRDELYELIFVKTKLAKKYETGLINSKEFFKEICEVCELRISFEELRDIYSNDKFTPINGMQKLIEILQKKYKIGLLSNTGEWDFDYFMNTFPFIKAFDSITTSFEVGAMKPDAKIFFDALNKLKFKPEECVYTDDILEFVEAARMIGINGIHFENTEKFKSELEKIVVANARIV